MNMLAPHRRNPGFDPVVLFAGMGGGCNWLSGSFHRTWLQPQILIGPLLLKLSRHHKLRCPAFPKSIFIIAEDVKEQFAFPAFDQKLVSTVESKTNRHFVCFTGRCQTDNILSGAKSSIVQSKFGRSSHHYGSDAKIKGWCGAPILYLKVDTLVWAIEIFQARRDHAQHSSLLTFGNLLRRTYLAKYRPDRSGAADDGRPPAQGSNPSTDADGVGLMAAISMLGGEVEIDEYRQRGHEADGDTQRQMSVFIPKHWKTDSTGADDLARAA